MSTSNLYLPACVGLAAIAVLGYIINRAWHGRTEFGVIDAMIVAGVVAIIGTAGIPLFETASREAKSVTLLENLRTLRSQIELYKLDHGAKPPIAYEGTFPQLIRATNDAGVPGRPGSKYPHGPYLREGVPVNPMTGRSIITLTDVFPPKAPSGNGGWLYHQPTGRIAPDVEGFLTR